MRPTVGLPRVVWWYGTAAGVAVGAAFTLSPTTVWFALLTPALFVWAGRGLGSRERVWVLGLLGAALASRLVALGAFFLSVDHFKEHFGLLIGDELFNQWRSQWLMYLALGNRLEPIDFRDTFGVYGFSGTHYVHAYWQYWFGLAPYGAHLLNVAIWLVAAIALHRVARRSFGPLPALGSFAVVLFMPTMFVWSISALKEPAYFFLTAMTIVGALAVVRGRRWERRVPAALLVALAVASISTVRTIGLAVTAGGLAIAAAGWLATRRAWLCLTVIVVLVGGGLWAVRRPAVHDRIMFEFRQAAIMHMGAVNTPGYAYWLLDPYFYERVDTKRYQDNSLSYMVPADAARFAIRAAASLFTTPVPWAVVSRPALALLPQQLAWYALGALAWVGVAAGWRRDALFTWVLLGNILLGGTAVALYNGNIGTLVRMRDMVVPIVVWLSALGGCVALEAVAHRLSEEGIRGCA